MVTKAVASLAFGIRIEECSSIAKIFWNFANKYPEIINMSAADFLSHPDNYPNTKILEDPAAHDFIKTLAFCETDKDLDRVCMLSYGDFDKPSLFCAIEDLQYHVSTKEDHLSYTRISPAKLTHFDNDKELISRFLNKFDGNFKCADFLFGWHLFSTLNK